MRLWGACADARAWASALSQRMGILEENLVLLADEAEDGLPVDESSSSFPSQRNIHQNLAWLTRDVRAGDFLTFIFCGRGTLNLGSSGQDEEDEEDAQDDEDDDEGGLAEEGLLCGNFDCTDWLQGRSMRVLTANAASHYWSTLPKGSSLTLVMDTENAVSFLPVSRRLDSAKIPKSVHLDGEPTPVREALVFGVTVSRAEAAQDLQTQASGVLGPPEAEPHRGDRGSRGLVPKPVWVPGGNLFWSSARSQSPAKVEPEVQAFAFAAAGPLGKAFEAEVRSQRNRRGGQPAARRGLLTQCLLQALEEMNYQGSYYALWWRAVRLLRRGGASSEQHFQLTFSDGTDPTCREAFEAVGAAEARAYAKRAELKLEQEQEISIEDGSWTQRGQKGRWCSSSGAQGAELHGEASTRHSSAFGCGPGSPGTTDCGIM
ncbi:unnamed protein product [Polarella glacialis]|uniref:Uncharacterized protein n=1 Tax=Polarella glacialis TaxID=89957 RepID=A0A813HI94_POLGL|nr:unnamed protein product [Polarella glacialis]